MTEIYIPIFWKTCFNRNKFFIKYMEAYVKIKTIFLLHFV